MIIAIKATALFVKILEIPNMSFHNAKTKQFSEPLTGLCPTLLRTSTNVITAKAAKLQ